MSSTWRAYSGSPDPDLVLRAATDLGAAPDDLLVVCVAEGGDPDLTGIVERLSTLPNPFAGGLFPELLTDGERRPEGALVLRLSGLGAPVVVRDFDDSSLALSEVSARLAAHRSKRPTALVLVDGLAPDISHFLGATYNELGSRIRYWGGGTGSITLDGRPSLFTRDGVFAGGAILALTTLEARLGVHHGWTHLRGPLVATRTRGNRVQQLNWKRADEVYAAAIRAEVGSNGTALRSVGDFTQSFPLGVQRQGDEFIVRDPVGVDDDGALVCVGDVPENAVLSILRGDPEALIAAAAAAAREAAWSGDTPARHCLIADCVSRVVYLGDRFDRELEAISRGLGEVSKEVDPVGVLTLGEISSRGDGYLEFFNKTCVVAVLREP